MTTTPEVNKGRVAIAWLAPDKVSSAFLTSVMNLVAYDTLRSEGRILHGGSFIAMGSGPNLAGSRNKVVEAFLGTRSEWLWMVDSDMHFPADTLDRLIAVADPKERPIVGGLCHGIKALPNGDEEMFPTLYYFDDNGDSARLQEYPDNELIKVGATGAACLLVHRSVFEGMLQRPDVCPAPYRWFQEVIVNGKPFSEDVTFCLRAGFCGYDTYVHTGVEIDHIKARHVTARTYKEWWHNEVTPPDFVVTGTGRSGTAFIAKAFDMLGIRCGHEEWFNPFNRRAPRLAGDASWIAVNHLDDFEGKVGLQVRHPLKVLGSLMNGDLFVDEMGPGHWAYPYWKAKVQDMELSGDHLADAVRYVAEWTERAEKHADKTWRLEDLDGELFAEVVEAMTGFEVDAGLAQQALDAVPKDQNKHPNTVTYTWDDLPEGEPFDALRALAERYGYE